MISLRQLMATPQPGNLLALCREFDQSCEALEQQLAGTVPADQLEWSFRLFHTKWQRLNEAIRRFGIPSVDHRLEDMEYSVASLGEVLGTNRVIGREELLYLFTEMDALCKQAAFDLHRKIVRGKYEPAFCDEICRNCDALSRNIYDLHRAATRPGFNPTASQLQPLFENWLRLKPMLAQCQADDRAYFADFRKQIEPMMVKLQVIYSN